MTPPQIVPAARQDVVVADAATGAPRRFTVYAGTVWLAPPPQLGGGGGVRVVSSPDIEALDPGRPLSLFLPDSLPYRSGADAVVSASGSPTGWVDQVGADARLLYPVAGRLSPDPRDGTRAWVAIELRGRGRLHAVSYTVSVAVAPDDVGAG